MKSPSFLSLIAGISALIPLSVGAQISIPAHTAYSEPDPRGVRISADKPITNWKSPANHISWFGELKQRGSLTCAVDITLPENAASKLRMTINRTAREVEITGKGDQPIAVDFGEFKIAKAGYQEFRLESLNEAGTDAGAIGDLKLAGTATENAHFNMKPRRNSASVHLAYPVPKGTEVAGFYCEMTGVEGPLYTYYMACGWHRGYFGMQINSPTERRIIFSVWDSGGEAIDRNKVDDVNRVQLVAKGEDVNSGSFGNEGTGGHSHLKFQWKTGEKQRFFVTAEPVDKTFTIYSGYYFRPDTKKWMLISSWKAPNEGGYMRGLYSFSENFGGQNGQLVRKARYGNQWIKTSAGEWQEITKSTFSHDGTGKADRLDRFMGLEDGEFFLSQGGFVEGFTKYGEPFSRPAKGTLPELNLPKTP